MDNGSAPRTIVAVLPVERTSVGVWRQVDGLAGEASPAYITRTLWLMYQDRGPAITAIIMPKSLV